MELEERFWEKIDWSLREVDRCWPWLGKPSHWGYGQFSLRDTQGKQVVARAHRLAYELFFEQPATMELDHRCHDPLTCAGGRSCPHRMCCNPYHLKEVTREENHALHRKNTKAAGQSILKRLSREDAKLLLERGRTNRWAAVGARESWSQGMRERWAARSPLERQEIGRKIADSKRRKP